MLTYWFFAGFFCVCFRFICDNILANDEKKEKLKKLRNLTTFDEYDFMLIVYISTFLFGGIILPYWIIDKLCVIIIKKRLIDFGDDF